MGDEDVQELIETFEKLTTTMTKPATQVLNPNLNIVANLEKDVNLMTLSSAEKEDVLVVNKNGDLYVSGNLEVRGSIINTIAIEPNQFGAEMDPAMLFKWLEEHGKRAGLALPAKGSLNCLVFAHYMTSPDNTQGGLIDFAFLVTDKEELNAVKKSVLTCNRFWGCYQVPKALAMPFTDVPVF